MKLVKRNFINLILILVLFCIIFTGCSKNSWLADSSAPTSKIKGKNGDVYLNTSNYDLYKMQNNKWIKIGNIKGEKGDKGDKGEDGKDGVTPTIEISNDGYWIINGKKTNTRAEGRDGKDGVSPLISISEEGYWVINGIKTAVKAKAQDGINGKNGQDGVNGKDGIDGKTPVIEFSEDGYWVINGVKTKIKAKGEAGKTPTIEISEDGYWIVDGTKTTLTISEDGYWVFNGVKTKIRAMYVKTLKGLCTYLENGVEAQTAGAKYSCEVSPGVSYNFYVLTTPKDEDTSIDLIMDQNIKTQVAWNVENGQLSNTYGPITAMTYLHNATKDWINIEPVNYTYNDKATQGTTKEDTSYTSFVSKNGIATITPLTGSKVTIGSDIEPLRARLPIYASDTTITEVTSKTNASYLYDNLDPNKNPNLHGYWTLSSQSTSNNSVWFVYNGGIVGVTTIDNRYRIGVRPVITLKF